MIRHIPGPESDWVAGPREAAILGKIKKVVLVVLDSVGVGALPDAGKYGDEGSNTLANTARAVGGLSLPNLTQMGLGNITDILGVPPWRSSTAAYGKMKEKSPGKDTTTGHWELAGLVLDKPFPVYPDGFPPEVIVAFQEGIGKEVLGNTAASGTEIIEELGEQHIKTGRPIVYTSADSVFQIAAHEDITPVDELYEMCGHARKILSGEHAVGRVIARPFIGKPGSFVRTDRRRDFSVEPPEDTLLDRLIQAGKTVVAVGKIKEIFAGKGISESVHISGNDDGIDKTLSFMRSKSDGLIFTNLVDFDMLYGHRKDPEGYARALEQFDRRLPEITGKLGGGELLILTADHGCDPTTPGTDHSREYVPLLVYGDLVKKGTNLGTRETFADLGATIAEIFGVKVPFGRSFLKEILGKRY